MPRTVPAELAEPPAESRRLLLIVLVVLGVVALPLGIAASLSWVEMPWSASSSRPVPEWVAVPQLRATTRDGVVVRARVSLDVPGAMHKAAIQRSLQQVGLLLELSVAERSRAQLGTAEGMNELAQDMRERLNGYLGVAEGEAGVQSVAIQDLLVKPQ